MLASGAQVGRYVIRRKLAEGGMAEIYTAHAVGPEGFSKDVVIKMIHGFLSRDPQFVQMFIAEARLASRLNHANVVQIFDFGKHDDSYYLAMEYVRGVSLWDLRKRCRERAIPLPPALAAEIGAQVARGLQYAHALTDGGQRLGVVHRDVTPHNVLLSYDGAVKLTDFGIAKATTSQTAPGMLKGKFAYMSPEQSRGEPVDARTDLFALGIVLWELLTGGRLFSGDSDLAVLRAVQESMIVPPARLNPEVPVELSDIVMKALARVPRERFQTAFELEKALANFVLRTATSIEDTSVGLFLQQVYREELEAPSAETQLPEDDALGDTHQRPAPVKTVTATPLPLPRAAVLGGGLPTGRLGETVATFSPLSKTLLDDDASRPTDTLTPMDGPSPSAQPGKPKTEQMPAMRRSVRKLEPLPVPAAAELSHGPSVIVSERHGQPSSDAAVRAAIEEPARPPLQRSNVPLYAGLALLVSVTALAAWYLWGAGSEPSPPVALAAPPPAEPRPPAAPAATPAPEPVPEDVAGAPAPTPAPVPVPPEDEQPGPAAAPEVEPPKPVAAAARPVVAAPVARKLGALSVKAVPFATVTVQGKAYEVVGVQKIPAPVGTYEISLSHPKKTTVERVTVTAGETTPVSFSAQ